jgi:hypothetical protein
MKFKKIKDEMILEVSIVSSEGKKSKNYHISTFGFHYVAENMEGLLKFVLHM